MGGAPVQARPVELGPRGHRDQVRCLLAEQLHQLIGKQPQLPRGLPRARGRDDLQRAIETSEPELGYRPSIVAGAHPAHKRCG